jgi:iron complex outermembrane receptor protein
VRFDTGALPVANGWSSFISYSHAEVDKFKGKGEANRDHVDFRSVLALPNASRVMVTALWNDSINNNYRFATKSQFAANPNFDFADTFIGNPTPVAGTRQVPVAQDIYYKLSLNPFRNAIITGKANLNLTSAVKLDIEPYFWYGYGTGGTQQFTLNEGGTFRGGLQDINGDGDRLDNHRLSTGYWYERARHRQTAPATRIDNDGNAADLWLRSQLILRADGTPYNNRDQLTISKAGSFFASDTMGFLGEKLRVDVGVKAAYIDRDFTNYANEGFGQGVDYKAQKRFSETLPSLGVRYQFDSANQVFANVAKNFKAPGNFAWGSAVVNGINRIDAINAKLRAETSISSDLGYRHYGEAITFSGSVFNSNFKDRLARQYDPVQALTIDTNVGDGRIRGFELELGTVPVKGFSGYVSTSYTRSRNESDLQVSATNIQPTAGKDFPDTPRWLSALSLQYAQAQYYANAQAKYTGKRFSSLTNDEWVGGYTTVDLNAGYRFGDFGYVRNVLMRANWSNIFNKRYLALNAGSGSLFTTNATGTGAQAPVYYMGAPRFASMSVSAEF